MPNANAWAASIKQLFAADKGTDFVADTVAAGAAFDLVMDLEIGENLNEHVDDLDVYMGFATSPGPAVCSPRATTSS